MFLRSPFSRTTYTLSAISALFLAGSAHAFSVNVSGSGAMTIKGSNGPDEARVIGLGAEGQVVVKDAYFLPVWEGDETITSILFIGKKGENKLVLTGVDVAGAVTVRGGPQKDILSVNGLLSAARLMVDHKGGNNAVWAGNAGNGDVIDLDNGITYESGNGKDTIRINELSVADGNPADTMIFTGGGNDTVDITGGGLDGLEVESRRLLIETGAGNDTVSIYDLDFTQGIQVLTAAGNDKININLNFAAESDTGVIGSAPYIDAIAGPGNDEVIVTANIAADINVNCGTGDDDADVLGNTSDSIVVEMCEDMTEGGEPE